MLIYTDKYLKDLIESAQIKNIEKLKNKKILVTGASGLICSAVIDMLFVINEAFGVDCHIYAASRNVEKINKRFYRFCDSKFFHAVEYDAEKTVSFEEEYDYIIHGASNANPALYGSNPVETMLGNFYGINNLLKTLKDSKKGRLLYISSSEVYGKKEDKNAYYEDEYGYVDILNSRACYPSSKRASETLCASYKNEYGVDYVIVRPGHVYGPTTQDSDNRASSQFARDVKNGKNIVMKSPGLQMRSYCYVTDCASAIIYVLLNGESGEAYNISNKNSVVTIREMAEEFAKAANVDVVFECATEKEKATFNMMDNSSLDSKKLENLGWVGKFTLNEGVIGTLDAIG